MRIKQIKEVEDVYISLLGRVKIVVSNNCDVEMKFDEIKDMMCQLGYKITQIEPDSEVTVALKWSERISVLIAFLVVFVIVSIFIMIVLFGSPIIR